MGAIANAFNTAWRAYVVDGVPGSGNNTPDKSECRAAGAALEAFLANPVMSNFGSDTTVEAKRANGTSGSPTAVVNGNILGKYQFNGYYVTGGPAYSSYAAEFRAEATQNWTSAAQGSRFVWKVTPNGTATPADAAWLDQDYSFKVKGGLGYQSGVGAGGSVTQATSITTGVALNALCGTITTVSQTIAAGAEADFTVTNNKVEANDVVVPCIKTHTSAGTFLVSCAGVQAGAFTLRLTNLHASTAGNNTLAINFVIIKGAAS